MLAGRLGAGGDLAARSGDRRSADPAAGSAILDPGPVRAPDLTHADDAEERHGSRGDPQRTTAARSSRRSWSSRCAGTGSRSRRVARPAASSRSSSAGSSSPILVVGAGLAGGLYLYGHQTLNAISAHSVARQEGAEGPPPDRVAVAAGHRAADRLRRARRLRRLRRLRVALRHGHARPRRPDEQHAVDALVPARPRRPDLLQRLGRAAHHRPDQLGLVDLRRRRARSTRSST